MLGNLRGGTTFKVLDWIDRVGYVRKDRGPAVGDKQQFRSNGPFI